jgi:hypothetical protein
MRRGLIARSSVELPDAVLDARLERLRAAMRSGGLDALLIYTNNTRPAGVSWLTGFVPYWAEALLAVPRAGAPVLVVALSFRVKTWIERVSRIGEVLHSPRVGLKAAEYLDVTHTGATVGVVEFDSLSSGIAADLREGGPSLAFRDATDVFAAVRQKADPAEIALAARAGAIAHRALRAAAGDTLNAKIAAVEMTARDLGAEEIYIAAAPDLQRDARFRRIEGEAAAGERFALRASVAYKGTWVRLVRVFGADDLAREAAARLAAAASLLPDDGGFAGFKSWLVEGCRATQPLDPLSGLPLSGSPFRAPNPLPPGALVSVQGVVAIEGCQVPAGAPALLGSPGEAASLLVEPTFD